MKTIIYQLRFFIPVWLVLLLTQWLPDNRISIRVRGWAVAVFLPGRPKRLELGRDVTLLNIDRLFLGDDVYIAKGSWINAIGKIVIGQEVVISPYVVMSSSKHTFKDGSVKKGGAYLAQISIGEGSWISSNSTVAAGVTIGKGVLVAANSLVTSDISNDKVVMGVPAQEIRDRMDRPGDTYFAR